jgi:type II secretion system protein H
VSRSRGFTIVELMVVVVIIGVFASLALVSMRQDRHTGDLDRFTNQIRDVMVSARRRAVATRSTYLVDLRAGTVAYCQRDPANANQASCPTDEAANCGVNGQNVACESVRAISAGLDAEVVQWANAPDIVQAGAPTTAIGGGRVLAFKPNGTCDSDLTTNVADGFTLYLDSIHDSAKQRKIEVYPASGRPRIIDTW